MTRLRASIFALTGCFAAATAVVLFVRPPAGVTASTTAPTASEPTSGGEPDSANARPASADLVELAIAQSPERAGAPASSPVTADDDAGSNPRRNGDPRPGAEARREDGLAVPLFDDHFVHFFPPPLPDAMLDRIDDRLLGQTVETTVPLPPNPGPHRAKRITARITVEPVLLEVGEEAGLLMPADPWTRAGYLAVVLPEDNAGRSIDGDAAGEAANEDWVIRAPGREIELVRFITPYGGPATFTQDLSAFAPLLSGETTLRLVVTTYSSPGWRVSARLEYEDHPPGVRRPAAVVPLFHDQEVISYTPPLEATVEMPPGLAPPRIRILSTGHAIDGRDGDEFISRPHTLRIDGRIVARWKPWSEAGDGLRAINPMAGRVIIDGRSLWSSDLDRTGWHPGRVVEPLIIPLPQLDPGVHDIELTINGIRPPVGDDPDAPYGYWRTSAVLLRDEPWPPVPDQE